MNELYNLGISEILIKNMLNIYPNLKVITDKEIIRKKYILKQIGCSDFQILNIISCNIMFLNRTDENITKLLSYLYKIGFSTLSILLDSNPYILNLEIFEIKKYIENRLDNGEFLEDIIDDMDSNPEIFNEI